MRITCTLQDLVTHTIMKPVKPCSNFIQKTGILMEKNWVQLKTWWIWKLKPMLCVKNYAQPLVRLSLTKMFTICVENSTKKEKVCCQMKPTYYKSWNIFFPQIFPILLLGQLHKYLLMTMENFLLCICKHHMYMQKVFKKFQILDFIALSCGSEDFFIKFLWFLVFFAGVFFGYIHFYEGRCYRPQISASCRCD